MDRLEGFIHRHRKLVLIAWLLLLLAAIPFAAKQTENLTSGGFTVPDSGSDVVDRGLSEFESAQRENLAIVIAQRPGSDAEDVRRTLDDVAADVERVEHLSVTQAAKDEASAKAGQTSVTIVPLLVGGDSNDAADAAADLRRELDLENGAVRGDVEVHMVGQQALWAGMQDLTKADLESAERAGFPIVALILLVVFGSLAAAGLPLALGFVSVALTGAVIYFLSQAMDMSVFVTNIASMIGIGVAVDYSLFVLARYRQEIADGASPEEARLTAMRTSGLAVAFSGVTVMLSLGGLFLVDSTTIRSMAVGAIVVVAISILGAVTFLPALMAVMGRRAYARSRLAVVGMLWPRAWRAMRRKRGSTHPDRARKPFWTSWTERVMRHPVLAAIGSSAILLALAVPALSLEFGDGALRQFPEDHETRVGFDLAAKATGPGANGPVLVLAEFEDGTASTPANKEAVATYVEGLKRDREAASVVTPQTSDDERAVLIGVAPKHDPESDEARALVDRLRADASGSGGIAEVATVNVGGPTAQVEDFKDLVSGSMWKILLFVMVFSYLVLLVLLRSLLLPLKAVLMNLLSVAAAYGVLVDGLPVRLVRRLPRLRVARLHQHDDPAVPARDRLRPVDGLRGLPAHAHPRALRRDRRQHAAPSARVWRRAPGRSRARR